MTALKWQRVADSDGTTIMYAAVAGQTEPRQPYLSYRISPASLSLRGNGTDWYTIELWSGERLLDKIGSVRDTAWGRERRGEYRLADAKRAAQQHYNETGERNMHNTQWDSSDTQFCVGCQLYHYRDECTDPYFNDPDNWN